MAPRGPRLDDTVLAPAGDQADDPRHAESADLDETAAHDPFVFFQTQLARISHRLTVEARDEAVITSLRLLAVLTVLSSTHL